MVKAGFASEVGRWRQAVYEHLTREDEGRFARRAHGYFVDRFAYRYFKQHVHGQESKAESVIRPDVSYTEWCALLEAVLVGSSTLDISPPSPHAIIPASQVLDDLLARWRDHLTHLGIPYGPESFQSPAGKTWAQFLMNSVHYPRRPAILGPTFVDRLGESERRAAVERVGVEGVMSLYIFLLQVHEESHLLQIGEPLLNEFHLAWLWCNFLSREELWWWQRSEARGTVFNLEYPWVSKLIVPQERIVFFLNDSCRAACLDGLDASMKSYDALCESAWQFDHGKIDYRQYLTSAYDIISQSYGRGR